MSSSSFFILSMCSSLFCNIFLLLNTSIFSLFNLFIKLLAIDFASSSVILLVSPLILSIFLLISSMLLISSFFKIFLFLSPFTEYTAIHPSNINNIILNTTIVFTFLFIIFFIFPPLLFLLFTALNISVFLFFPKSSTYEYPKKQQKNNLYKNLLFFLYLILFCCFSQNFFYILI